VYAGVSDTGAPAAGVAGVTANASALTAGATAAPLAAGASTVAGVSYGYGSAALTVGATVRAWTVPVPLTATDAAGNAATVGGPTAYVDRDLAVDRLARIDGAAAADYMDSVVDAGDVDGDGLPDLLVGASGASPSGRSGAGSAYVVFGTGTPADLDLAGLGTRGFRIDGPAAGASLGWSVTAPYAPFAGRTLVGATYVVFGKSSTTAVDTAALGTAGYTIGGASTPTAERLGTSIADAGDVDGDHVHDLLIGCRDAAGYGRALVVFSHGTATDVDAAALGTDGYVVDGVASTAGIATYFGSAVANAGDVNADGVPDQVIAAPGSDLSGRTDAGSVFVVLGQRGSTTTISTAGAFAGYRVDGAVAGDELGGDKYEPRGVGGAGDLNGDGVPDQVLGAPYADPSGRSNAGTAYVIYGRTTATTVDTASLSGAATSAGYRIDGAAAGNKLGDAVGRDMATGTGMGTDVDRDGRPDVLLGAPSGDPGGRAAAGIVYVVRGVATPATVDLLTPGTQAFLVHGSAAGEKARSVAVLTDRDGDNRPDLAVTAGDASPGGRARAGSAYLVAG
jgi:hypothetical protein